MTLEAPVLQRVRLEASKLGYRLFRNNRGLFYTIDGVKGLIAAVMRGDLNSARNIIKNYLRLVQAGLDANGSSDLIGFAPVVITPAMVGKTIAVFMCAEVKKPEWKSPTGKTEKEQENFIRFINSQGGIGFFINNSQDLKKRVDEYIERL